MNMAGETSKACVVWMHSSLVFCLLLVSIPAAAGGEAAQARNGIARTRLETGHGAPEASMQQGGKNRFRTVERACVVDLSAPKHRGGCHLGAKAPPARLVVKGWYVSPLLDAMHRETSKLQKAWPNDIPGSLAILRRIFHRAPQSWGRDSQGDVVRFWQATPVERLKYPSYLNPPPGGRDWWPKGKDVRVYTREELVMAAATLARLRQMYDLLENLAKKDGKSRLRGMGTAGGNKKGAKGVNDGKDVVGRVL